MHSFLYRWCWSPLEEIPAPDGTKMRVPIVRAYSAGKMPYSPRLFDEGPSLCYVEFTPYTLAAAKQDPRIVILDSIHSRRSVHQTVDAHGKLHAQSKHSVHVHVQKKLAEFDITPDQTLHDLLLTLHHHFEGETAYLPKY
jgi:hypothetical protein